MPKHGLHDVAEVAAMIMAGKVLLVAGDETLLAQLPPGCWIGGTASNFVVADGGIETASRIFVTDLTTHAVSVRVVTYDAARLNAISADYPENGFAVIILPGLSPIHMSYGKDILTYNGVFNAPLTGWISGVAVNEIGVRSPKVFAGQGVALDNQAVVMHVELKQGWTARLDIINLFTRGKGAVFEFLEEGFACEGACLIDGRTSSLADFIAARQIDTRLPLVADYSGAMVNVSVKSVDAARNRVEFYAPVLKGVTYRLADPVEDYVARFEQAARGHQINTLAFSCNCILNYLYADLSGKKTGAMVGPVTFGEIAYILLNQTLVYLSLETAV